MPTRVGIVGFGGLGRVHANSLAEMEDVEVAAVCDARAEQLKAGDVSFNIDTGKKIFNIANCHTYTNFREMLRKEQLAAVVTALPTDLHAKFAITAMKAGCHVFTEKPMALTLKECDRMIAARDQTGRQLMVGQCLRFWPEYDFLLNAIKTQNYGRLLALIMERIGSYSTWSADGWMNDARRSGSVPFDLHIHDADWTQYALGRPAGIFAAGVTGRSGGMDDLTTVWDYPEGPMVTIRSSWLYTGFMMNFRALFERAVVEFGVPPEPALRVIQDNKPVKPDIQAMSPYVAEMRYFLDVVQGKHKNEVCPAESTRETIALVLQELKSSRRQKRIELKL